MESKAVLKSLPAAHVALAELKGLASTIPNQSILINTLGLQEAKDSSAIENIITTHDDLYKSELNLNAFKSIDAIKLQNYIEALRHGFTLIYKNKKVTFLYYPFNLSLYSEMVGTIGSLDKVSGKFI